jgi:hypothetical protein
MALSSCTECQTIEGEWRKPTAREARGFGMDYLDEDVPLEDLICCACDSFGSYRGIPEHDDMDMER